MDRTPAERSPHHDEVDGVVAAWQRERPDIDTTPMQVWSRVARLGQLLDASRARAFANQDVQAWEFDVLAALRREGSPYELSPGALIHQTLSTSGTMTNRIDRLAARGMVERRPDPRDRRGVRVRLTPGGMAAVEGAIADLVAHEHRLLEVLTKDEADVAADLLRRLLVPFEPE